MFKAHVLLGMCQPTAGTINLGDYMMNITAIKSRLLGALAILGLTNACGDMVPGNPQGASKITQSTMKSLEKHFNVSRPSNVTMKLGTQEGRGGGEN